MKRSLWILALLAVTVGSVAQQASRGQVPGQKPLANPGEVGSGAQGSTLRYPGMDAPAPAAGPVIPPSLQGAWNQTIKPSPYAGLIPTGAPQGALPPANQVDINRDITITPQVGPWTILVMSYTTPRAKPGQPAPNIDAARMAREFVTEWSGNPAYAKFKLKAHVFNLGADERQKEYERVQKLRQEQVEALNQLKLDGRVMPVRAIPTIHFDEQTAVLLGGFPDADAANKVVMEIRKLPPPDLKRVKVDCIYSGAFEPGKGPSPSGSGNPSQVFGVSQYVNPFTKATPVHNPTAPKEQPGMTSAAELEYLRKVNSKEPFSLLNTRRPFTLAVKQFTSPFKATTDAKDAENFLTHLVGLSGKKTAEKKDYAFQNAHNLADGLRKSNLKLEAYVLHCQCCSYVTVGSYNGPQDPELVQMQRRLVEYFRQEGFQFLDMYPHPTPMAVPGVPMGAMPGIAAR